MINLQTSKIRNIIFDLGGVLLNINPLLSLEELVKLSGISKTELRDRLASEKIFEKYDTGEYDSERFRDELRRIMDKNATDQQIDDAWNALLLDFPAERVQLLQSLQPNYRIFLLSNTNEIHFKKYTSDFLISNGFDMETLFEQLFLSYEIGIHKPDAGIYTYVLEQVKLVAAETLFIDDSHSNVEAAVKLSFAGLHLTGNHEITDYFGNGFLIPEQSLPQIQGNSNTPYLFR